MRIGSKLYRAELSVDIETYSETDLRNTGLYPYVADDAHEVLIFAYAYGDDEPTVVDIACGEKVPDQVVKDFYDPTVLKTAFNAGFEITNLTKHWCKKLLKSQWIDTMVLAAMLGLPTSLDGLSKAINAKDEQKDAAGKALIKYFSMPCKPTKVNGGRTRNLPEHDPEKWELYKQYCKDDVVAERAAKRKLMRFPINTTEMNNWRIDQRINDRGVLIDVDFVQNIIAYHDKSRAAVIEEMKQITGLENPNSPSKLKAWFADNGLGLEDMTKATIAEALDSWKGDPVVAKMLRYRQFTGKSSIAKYEKMLQYTQNLPDHRARGTFFFYGARTGRWAGRGIQFQNLPRTYVEDLDYTRKLVADENWDMFEVLHDEPAVTLSELIRPAIIAPEGKELFVSDFSAIEARVIAWLAEEQWRVDVFKTHGRIYEASASQMFNVPLASIGKGSPLRQQGKVAELALGYQGGSGAMATMDKDDEIRPDLSDEAIIEWIKDQGQDPEKYPWEAARIKMIDANYTRIVQLWREASPNIKKLWGDMERAAVKAIRTGERIAVQKGVYFEYEREFLFMVLPSGRRLSYPFARVERTWIEPKDGGEPFMKDQIHLMAPHPKTGQWASATTYGGKLVENCVQAIARDVLASKIRDIEKRLDGFDVVGHVHDEVITEAPIGSSLEDLNDLLAEPMSWADDDLVLTAEGYHSPYYKKD